MKKRNHIGGLCGALFLTAVITSCADSYVIQGSSSIARLDDSKLYLKTIKGSELKSIDSCDVVHGQFSFSGSIDSTRMCTLFMDEQSMMPLVLENGIIRIRIDNAKQTVSGTPLNDELYRFIDRHTQLDNQKQELMSRQSRMILDGIGEDTINRELNIEAARIAREEDSLITHFIIDNFDNVLGPGVFMMLTVSYPYPVLTPQIEDIMSKATSNFKNDEYVRDYYAVACENERRMQGLDSPVDSAAASYTAPSDTESPSVDADTTE